VLHRNYSVPVASRLRQTDFTTAQALVGRQAQSVAPAGTLSDTFQATGFIVNYPVSSLDVNPGRYSTTPRQGTWLWPAPCRRFLLSACFVQSR
jgi:hypothetical protein